MSSSSAVHLPDEIAVLLQLLDVLRVEYKVLCRLDEDTVLEPSATEHKTRIDVRVLQQDRLWVYEVLT